MTAQDKLVVVVGWVLADLWLLLLQRTAHPISPSQGPDIPAAGRWRQVGSVTLHFSACPVPFPLGTGG